HQVQEIEKHVHLSRTEEFIQGLRAFFYLSPSEYLEIKASNNQLVKRAIDFLKENTHIKRYIFPAFHNATTLYADSEILWKKKDAIVLDESNPDAINEGRLFCLSDSSNQENTPDSSTALEKKLIYDCKNAIGVEYPLNRTSDITFISLEKGEDKAIALPFSPMLFLVQNGKKTYKGSHQGNLFILEGDAISGLLQGGDGIDILKLNHFSPQQSDYLLIDELGYLCGKNSTDLSFPPLCPSDNRVRISKMDHIHGRTNEQDVIYLRGNTCFIDGYKGKNNEYPDMFFITHRSYKNPKFVLRNNTLIMLSLKSGIHTIDYSIPRDEEGEAEVQVNVEEAIQYRFFFECPLETIRAIHINHSISFSQLSGYPKKAFRVLISDFQNSTLLEDAANLATISYFFKGIEVKLLNKDQLYVREIEHNNRTVDEKIELFTKIAQRLKKTFSVQLMDNSTLSIGHGKHEIFYANGLSETHLIGNGGENVYVILPTDHSLFPLAETILYDTSKNEAYDFEEPIDTLDLRGIVKKTKKICQHELIYFNVTPVENDLNVNLSADCPDNIPIANIKLKAALIDNWYQKLDIFLDDSISRNIIAIDNATFTLKSAPLIVNSNKAIIILTNKDIEKGLEILILKNIGNYSFFRNQTDLILTNALTSPADYCTLICHQFYALSEMREKILSVVFNFFDQSIQPQNNLTAINFAANFSDIYVTQIDNSNTLLSSTVKTNTPSIQEGLSLETARSKRQANSKKLISSKQQIQSNQPLVNNVSVGTMSFSTQTIAKVSSLEHSPIKAEINKEITTASTAWSTPIVFFGAISTVASVCLMALVGSMTRLFRSNRQLVGVATAAATVISFTPLSQSQAEAVILKTNDVSGQLKSERFSAISSYNALNKLHWMGVIDNKINKFDRLVINALLYFLAVNSRANKVNAAATLGFESSITMDDFIQAYGANLLRSEFTNQVCTDTFFQEAVKVLPWIIIRGLINEPDKLIQKNVFSYLLDATFDRYVSLHNQLFNSSSQMDEMQKINQTETYLQNSWGINNELIKSFACGNFSSTQTVSKPAFQSMVKLESAEIPYEERQVSYFSGWRGLLSVTLGTATGVTLTATLAYVGLRHLRRREQAPAVSTLAAVMIPLMSLPRADATKTVTKTTVTQNGLVACDNPAFINLQCVKNQSPLGILGYCSNENIVLTWFINAEDSSFSYMVFDPYSYKFDAAQPVSFKANSLYFLGSDQCQQFMHVDSMNCVSSEIILTKLPVADYFLKRAQLKQRQREAAMEQFWQRAQAIGVVYLGEQCLVHTRVGDYFRAAGLTPHWHEHDPSHFLRRVLRSMQSTHLYYTLSAVCLETALLYPSVQARLPAEAYRSKLVVRFIADLLQFGPCVSSCVPALIEFLTYQHPWSYQLTIGLRGALSMLEVINDPSTWYLVVSLFILPQLPYLLENLGIPVTRSINYALESLEKLLIPYSLLLSVQTDYQRLGYKERALQAADQRVHQGKERVSLVKNATAGFFRRSNAKNTAQSEKDNLRQTDDKIWKTHEVQSLGVS
ncbi:MAG: hypothetical protein RLY40_1360, partial [Pseudomonadota bacterium]